MKKRKIMNGDKIQLLEDDNKLLQEVSGNLRTVNQSLGKENNILTEKLNKLIREYEIVFEHRNTLLHAMVLLRIQVGNLQEKLGINPRETLNSDKSL